WRFVAVFAVLCVVSVLMLQAAQATAMPAKMVITNGPSVPRGLPLSYKLTVTNNTASTQSIEISIYLIRPGGAQQTVNDWHEYLLPSTTEADSARVVTSRWFPQTGTFTLVAVSD